MAGIPPIIQSIEKDDSIALGSTTFPQDREPMPTPADSGLSGSGDGSSSPSASSHGTGGSDEPTSLQDLAKATVMLQLRLLQLHFGMPDAGRISIERTHGPLDVANLLRQHNRLTSNCLSLSHSTWARIAAGDISHCRGSDLIARRRREADAEQTLLWAAIHRLEDGPAVYTVAYPLQIYHPSRDAALADHVCGMQLEDQDQRLLERAMWWA